MDTSEYLKTIIPGSRRSALDQYKQDILLLVDKGCSQKQICRFLEIQGVRITQGGVSKYLKKLRKSLEAPRNHGGRSGRPNAAGAATEKTHQYYEDLAGNLEAEAQRDHNKRFGSQ